MEWSGVVWSGAEWSWVEWNREEWGGVGRTKEVGKSIDFSQEVLKFM